MSLAKEIGKVHDKIYKTVNGNIKAFFDGECKYPLEYLKELAYETAIFLPLLFFVKKSGKSVKK